MSRLQAVGVGICLQGGCQQPVLVNNAISFNLLFGKKNILIGLEGKSVTPRWEDTFLFRSYQQLPGLGL